MKKITLFLLGLFLTVTMFAPMMAHADNTDDAADIARAETYLRALKTAKASFVQRSDNGGRLTGTFYLKRPGKLRFEYNETDDFVVADGIFIYFYDSELKEQSNAPIGQTLADFLLRKDLSLTSGLSVQDIQTSADAQVLTLAQKGDEGAGTVRLFFSKNPYALTKWQIIDATGATTEIALANLQTDLKLPSHLFHYIAPKGDKPVYNQ